MKKGDYKMKRIISLTGIILTVALFITSCGGGTTTSDTTNDGTTDVNSIDSELQQFKVWHYLESDVSNDVIAELLSTNYYSTEIKENIYMAISLKSSGGGYFSFYVIGTPEDKIGTVMTFSPKDYLLISFDNAKSEFCYVKPSPSNSLLAIIDIDNFIQRLKSSQTCTIFVESPRGNMTYNFDTRNLQW